MKCPICQRSTKVTNSRSADHGRAIKRRRTCLSCDRRFTTYERIELFGLQVQKRNGSKEPYLRHKLELGLRKALEKRPVTEEQFQKLVASIEHDLFNLEKDTVASDDIGQIVLLHLRELDKVAYLRFASVCRNFRDSGSHPFCCLAGLCKKCCEKSRKICGQAQQKAQTSPRAFNVSEPSFLIPLRLSSA